MKAHWYRIYIDQYKNGFSAHSISNIAFMFSHYYITISHTFLDCLNVIDIYIYDVASSLTLAGGSAGSWIGSHGGTGALGRTA